MQPFGLFSLLQTLLESQPKPEPQTPETDFPTGNSAQNQPPTPATPAQDETENTNRQAIVQFLQEHENRAKRTRKR